MRIILSIFASLTFLATNAQTHFRPLGAWGHSPWEPYVPYSIVIGGDSNLSWHLRPFASVSAGYWFLGGGVAYFSAPMGIVAYRPLDNNVTVFGAATVAPAAFHFSSLYGMPAANPANNFTGLGTSTGVTGGLMYTNDARTFSISGSISVERSSTPVYVPAPNPGAGRY